MRDLAKIITIIIVVFTIFSCKKNEVKDAVIEKNEILHSDQKVSKDCKDVHWSHHEGEEGPENWAALCDEYSDCGGETQSPINIETTSATKGELKAIEFAYNTSNTAIVNNGHTVQFNVSGENFVTLKDKKYQLLQFHYHALSEHTIDGKHAPIEVHFVHKHSDTDYAVLGIMIEEGEKSELFDTHLVDFPTSKGEFFSENEIDLLSIFPKDKGYFNYNGSLTTPPCSEVVDWFLLRSPITASKEQIEAFSKILHDNYRPIQPLNKRLVQEF